MARSGKAEAIVVGDAAAGTDLASLAGDVADLLRTLANRNRLMIVCTLVEGEHSVGQLESDLGIHQPTLSQQLTVLRAAGIVETRREAKQIFYRLTDEKAARLIEALHGIFCADGAAPARPAILPGAGARRRS